MHWNPVTRYQLLLKINNAVITRTTREELFQALAAELKVYFPYDRLSINLYDAETQTLSYFAVADGVEPSGISCKDKRPLTKGAISRMVIQSGQPVIIDDLSRYTDYFSVRSMVDFGLKSTLAFPMTVRNRILGSIHFSFRETPPFISELIEVLTDVSNQVAIAVDNMMAYTRLQELNANLVRQKHFLMSNTEDYQQGNFIYAAPCMVEIMRLVEQVADTDATVLITGETGTGKDYIARCIHNLSSRGEHLFVKINCPALAPSLFESELFGHAKGAFTGADSKRVGRLEMADGGTVFLDEVGDLPASLQAKLLHVLQDGRFERVGDNRQIEANFRVISATNKDLETAIKAGQFRRDLYYRLNLIHIHVPPIRDRRDDIPLLVERLTDLHARQMNRPAPVYTQEALESLSRYSWPGNVREVKNLAKRMVILRAGEQITGRDINRVIDVSPPQAGTGGSVTTLADAERSHIERALIRCRGVVGGQGGAASLLGLPRSTLQYRMRKYGLDPRNYGEMNAALGEG